MISVSVIVPVYSGESFLQALTTEVEHVREAWIDSGAPLSLDELIFVDDSAVDHSPEMLDQIPGKQPWVRVIHLARNFGQHAATIAGILHSSGDWVVTMDEDLQHPPSEISNLLRKVAETRCDIVYGSPEGGVHTARRDFSSRSYKRIIEWLTGNPHIRNVNSYRLIRGPIARGASSFCSHDTYFDVALSWLTQRVQIVEMNLKDQRYRKTGKSGYTWKSLFSHARRLLISSQLKVLRLAVLIGLLAVALSLCIGAAVLFMKIFAPGTIAVAGWASLMLAIALFGGFCIFLLGIALEYISMLVVRAHGRPLFFTIDRSADTVLIQYFGLT
jgi:glycosyltransferase involved in cell wall biosynthesis